MQISPFLKWISRYLKGIKSWENLFSQIKILDVSKNIFCGLVVFKWLIFDGYFGCL